MNENLVNPGPRMTVYVNDWEREQVVTVAHLFDEPVDNTNNQTKQHETP